MSFAEADFDGLIDLIYEAPLDFGLWPEVLHRISRAATPRGPFWCPPPRRRRCWRRLHETWPTPRELTGPDGIGKT